MKKKRVKKKLENQEDLPGEEWRDCVGYEHYQVSNLGRVKSKDRTNQHKTYLDSEVNFEGRVLKPSSKYSVVLSHHIHGREKVSIKKLHEAAWHEE